MLGIPKKTDCILAQFSGPAALLEAGRKIREAGYRKYDCHSPFPIHGMDKAMGLKRSPIGWIAGLCALVGGIGGIALQWYASTISYPLVISGKPFFSFQAYVPVTFALAVLGAAFGSVFGMFFLNRLPRWHHPLFKSERFGKFSDDAFFVSIEADDPLFDATKTAIFLESIGGIDPEVLKDE